MEETFKSALNFADETNDEISLRLRTANKFYILNDLQEAFKQLRVARMSAEQTISDKDKQRLTRIENKVKLCIDSYLYIKKNKKNISPNILTASRLCDYYYDKYNRKLRKTLDHYDLITYKKADATKMRI